MVLDGDLVGGRRDLGLEEGVVVVGCVQEAAHLRRVVQVLRLADLNPLRIDLES